MMKKYPKVIAVDFDETLGFYNPKIKENGYVVKKVNNVPNPSMVKAIQNWRKLGHKVIIYTSRWWGDYNALAEWLKKHHLEVDDIVLGRLKADVYVCDKSVYAYDPDMNKKVDDLLNNTESWGVHYNRYIGSKKKKKRVNENVKGEKSSKDLVGKTELLSHL